MINLNKTSIFQSLKGKKILILFFICSLLNLFSVLSVEDKIFSQLKINQLIFISKPLLLLLLLGFFIRNIRHLLGMIEVKLMIFAIIFSNIGDILLLFTKLESSSELFFLAGLGSFLLTHVCYSFAFYHFAKSDKFKFPLHIIFPLLLFWILFNSAFAMRLDGIIKPAIMLYSFIIMAMVYFAWHLRHTLHSKPSYFIWIGALLFLVSDTCIGLNKFGQDLFTIPLVHLIIMITYLSGQLLIILGSILHLNNE